MEINVTCTQFRGYANARVELDESANLADPIEVNDIGPARAIALAVLQHLMTTGQIKLVLNGKEVVTQEDEESYEDFYGCEWWHDHIIK